MSEQRLNNVFREALWEVHGKKCFYCKENLLLVVMEVDHVLPETLQKDRKRRLEVLKQSGLAEDFRILGFENLAPSCHKCNSDKGETILPPGVLAIHLAKLSKKIPAVQEALEKQRAARDLENVLRVIQHSLDQGKFTHEELTRQIEFLKRVPDGIRGASRSFPASPEVAALKMDIREPSRILLTRQAMDDLRQHDMDIRDIYVALYRTIAGSAADMRRTPDGMYIVKGPKGLRVAFRPAKGSFSVESVFAKRTASARQLY
jgi:hypothetical protein